MFQLTVVQDPSNWHARRTSDPRLTQHGIDQACGRGGGWRWERVGLELGLKLGVGLGFGRY